MTHLPTAAGSSSFDLINSELFFNALPISDKMTIVDAACGNGTYLFFLAKNLKSYHKLIGLDLWKEGIQQLNSNSQKLNLSKVTGIYCDLGKTFPLSERVADICLMATVIHDFKSDGIEKNTIKEAFRILKPGGILAAIEFKKISSKPGPRIDIRLSPEELQNLVEPFGLKQVKSIEIGISNYLSLFQKPVH